MTRKAAFFDGCSWFKFNNLGLALGTNLKLYTSVVKGLKLKTRKFWELIPAFAEVTEEKLVRGSFLNSILNRVKKLILVSVDKQFIISIFFLGQKLILLLAKTIFPFSHNKPYSRTALTLRKLAETTFISSESFFITKWLFLWMILLLEVITFLKIENC